jgi:hypothetical protein
MIGQTGATGIPPVNPDIKASYAQPASLTFLLCYTPPSEDAGNFRSDTRCVAIITIGKWAKTCVSYPKIKQAW